MSFGDTFMAVRMMILVLFFLGGAVSLYAGIVRKQYHAMALFFWAVNVIAFTAATILCASGEICVDVIVLNMWSGIVRLHGGFVVLALSIYYLRRRLT